MPRALLVVAISTALLCGAERARADVAADLERADDLLRTGDYQAAEHLAAGVVLSGPRLDRGERAEGWRIYGLALFMLGRHEQAEHALLQFLQLEPDATLDPGLVPPEAIRFFDEVRLDHAAEIARHRPRPRRKRYWALNLVPPAGQFQNGDRAKGWILAGAGTALLAANVTTYFVLRGWCDRAGNVCEDDAGVDKTDAARTVRRINYATGAALAGLYLYGVWDGFSGHRRITREERADDQLRVGVQPTRQGALVIVQGRF